jgi:hypothetical protein
LWTSRSITTNYAHVDVYIQEEERWMHENCNQTK